MRRFWTSDEEAYLRQQVGTKPYRRIAAALGRTVHACHGKAAKLGISARRGSDGWKERVARAHRGKGPNGGSFQAGHAPWNTGLKGLRLSPTTEFKKGQIRGRAARRWRAVGTIVIHTVRKKGRVHRSRWIKVRETGPVHRRYEPLARYMYARQIGPIPEGHVVVHADGNTLNDSPDNWRCIPLNELMAFVRSVRPGFEPKRRKRAAAVRKERAVVERFRRAERLKRGDAA